MRTRYSVTLTLTVDHFVVENIQKKHRLAGCFFEPEKKINRLTVYRALTTGLMINRARQGILRTDSTDKCTASKSRHKKGKHSLEEKVKILCHIYNLTLKGTVFKHYSFIKRLKMDVSKTRPDAVSAFYWHPLKDLTCNLRKTGPCYERRQQE